MHFCYSSSIFNPCMVQEVQDTQLETKQLDRNSKISKVHSGQITVFYRRSLKYVRKKKFYWVNTFHFLQWDSISSRKINIRGIYSSLVRQPKFYRESNSPLSTHSLLDTPPNQAMSEIFYLLCQNCQTLSLFPNLVNSSQSPNSFFQALIGVIFLKEPIHTTSNNFTLVF